MGQYLDRLQALGPEGRKKLADTNPHAFKILAREAKRERGRDDFWYFMTEVLGNKILYEPLHGPIVRSLDAMAKGKGKKKKLILLPRGHIKSTIFTAGYAVWRMVRNPNIRMLLISHKVEPDAKGFVKMMMEHLEDQAFQDLYPEIRPEMTRFGKPVKWTPAGLRLERTKGAPKMKEDTVMASAIGANVTGRHFEGIISDDLVTADNVRTPDAIRKTREFRDLCEALLDPGGWEINIGTRYDFYDEYGYISDTPAVAAEYDIFHRTCLRCDRCDHDIRDFTCPDCGADAVPTFPTRFTVGPEDEGDPELDPLNSKKSLKRIKATNSEWFWCSQYLNDPIDPSTQLYQEQMVNWIDALPDDRHYKFFRVCDLSSEEATESRTAIVTGAVDDQSNIFITDVFYGQFKPSEIVDELISGQTRGPMEQWPQVVGFEPAPWERQIKHSLEQEMANRGVFVPYQFLDPSQAQMAKDDRIKGLHWWWANGKFYCVKGARNIDMLVEEFLRFPRSAYKDIADAASQIPHIMWPAGAVSRQLSPQEKLKKRRERQELNEIYWGGGENNYIGNRRLSSTAPTLVRLGG